MAYTLTFVSAGEFLITWLVALVVDLNPVVEFVFKTHMAFALTCMPAFHRFEAELFTNKYFIEGFGALSAGLIVSVSTISGKAP